MGIFDKKPRKRIVKAVPGSGAMPVRLDKPPVKDLYYKTIDGFDYQIRVISNTDPQPNNTNELHPAVIFNMSIFDFVNKIGGDTSDDLPYYLSVDTDKKIIPLSYSIQIWDQDSPPALVDQYDLVAYQARDVASNVLPDLTNSAQQLYYPMEPDATVTNESQLNIRPHSDHFKKYTAGNYLVWAFNKWNINAPVLPGTIAPDLFVTTAVSTDPYTIVKTFMYLELLS